LLSLLWNGRVDWAAQGHWLSINLPATLPAPLTQARVGRDKIGAAADILETLPERIRYRLRRGRPGTITASDENACLNAGQISVVRYCWFAEAPLPEEVIAAWQDAIG
jgi:5'-nucleotidase